MIEKWIKDFKGVNFEDIPKSTIHMAKRCLLDTLGVACKGISYPNMPPLQNIINPLNTHGSTAIGFSDKVDPSDAALYNGTAAHSVELDDTFREGSIHLGVVVIPVALAVGQETNASGVELLKSIIIGYEVMGRVAMSSKGTLFNRGFHPTSVCGVYGAAATAAYLYNLTETETNMALGIAGNQSFGLMAYKSNGAWTKRLNPGWAGKIGIMASKLAAAGYIGSDNIIEGRFGFLQAYCESFDSEILQTEIINDYLIDKVGFKPYSSCRFTHTPIDALFEIIKNNNVDINQIKKINVYTHKTAIEATMKPLERKYRPQNTVDAQFSIPFCLGLALKYKSVLPDMFTENMLGDPDVLSIADKVEGFEDKSYTQSFPKEFACRVVVKTSEAVYEHEMKNPKGDPENPLKDSDLITKFKNLTEEKLSKEEQEKIIDLIWSIENIQNTNEFMKLFNVNTQSKNIVY